MKKPMIVIVGFIVVALCRCEQYVVSPVVNAVFHVEGMTLTVKVADDDSYSIDKLSDLEGEYLSIDVNREFTIRATAPIVPGESYRLRAVVKNETSNPIILYSFWKKPVTETRHICFHGVDGNPPVSVTQDIHGEWMVLEETFHTEGEENSFMLTVFAREGKFSIRRISIERLD